jgi:hypothetical protein
MSQMFFPLAFEKNIGKGLMYLALLCTPPGITLLALSNICCDLSNEVIFRSLTVRPVDDDLMLCFKRSVMVV